MYHCLSLPGAYCLVNCHFICFICLFLVVSGRKVNPVSVTLFWPDMELYDLNSEQLKLWCVEDHLMELINM